MHLLAIRAQKSCEKGLKLRSRGHPIKSRQFFASLSNAWRVFQVVKGRKLGLYVHLLAILTSKGRGKGLNLRIRGSIWCQIKVVFGIILVTLNSGIVISVYRSGKQWGFPRRFMTEFHTFCVMDYLQNPQSWVHLWYGNSIISMERPPRRLHLKTEL